MKSPAAHPVKGQCFPDSPAQIRGTWLLGQIVPKNSADPLHAVGAEMGKYRPAGTGCQGLQRRQGVLLVTSSKQSSEVASAWSCRTIPPNNSTCTCKTFNKNNTTYLHLICLPGIIGWPDTAATNLDPSSRCLFPPASGAVVRYVLQCPSAARAIRRYYSQAEGPAKNFHMSCIPARCKPFRLAAIFGAVSVATVPISISLSEGWLWRGPNEKPGT